MYAKCSYLSVLLILANIGNGGVDVGGSGPDPDPKKTKLNFWVRLRTTRK